ncbi:MAG: IPT/TIG domain-containing protein [Planctomycetes bacterium]|nr:IPT/TIG domain-containing protein [Planctomycetota bacterium]
MKYWSADGVGNVETAGQIQVMIDKTPPVTTATRSARPNAHGWNNTDVTVSFDTDDNLSGLAERHVELDGEAQEDTDQITITEEGTHQVAFWSVDVAGNIEQKRTLTVRIDKTAPQITDLSPAEGAHLKEPRPMLSARVDDGVAGVSPASIEMLLDGQVLTHSYDQETGTIYFSPQEDLPDGEHILTVGAADLAGNSTEVHSSFQISLGVTPIVMEYSPEEGFEDGGTWVEFLGEGFTPDMTVTFGGEPAEVKFYNEGKIYAISPAHQPDVVDITLSNGPGLQTVLKDAFTYLQEMDVALEGIEDGGFIAANEEELVLSGNLSGGVAPYTLKVTHYSEEGITHTFELPAGPFEVTIPISEGFHYVFALLTDDDGHFTWKSFYVFVDTTPPAPPAWIAAHAGDGRVAVIWDKSPSRDAVQYRLDKRLETEGEEPGDWEEIDTVEGSTRALLVTDLTNGQNYGFRVTAIDRVQLQSAPEQTPVATARPIPFVDLGPQKREITRKHICLRNDKPNWEKAIGTVDELEEARSLLSQLSGLTYETGVAFPGDVSWEEEDQWLEWGALQVYKKRDLGWDSVGLPNPQGDGWLPVQDYVTDQHGNQLTQKVGRVKAWLECSPDEIVDEVLNQERTGRTYSGMSGESLADALAKADYEDPRTYADDWWDQRWGPGQEHVWFYWGEEAHQGDSMWEMNDQQWDVGGITESVAGEVHWKDELPQYATRVFWAMHGPVGPTLGQNQAPDPLPVEFGTMDFAEVQAHMDDPADFAICQMYGEDLREWLGECDGFDADYPVFNFYKKMAHRPFDFQSAEIALSPWAGWYWWPWWSLEHKIVMPVGQIVYASASGTFREQLETTDSWAAREFTIPCAVELQNGPGALLRGRKYVSTEAGEATLATRWGGQRKVYVQGVNVQILNHEGKPISETDEELYGALLAKANWPADKEWSELDGEQKQAIKDVAKDVRLVTNIAPELESEGRYVISVGAGMVLMDAAAGSVIADGRDGATTKEFVDSPPAGSYKLVAAALQESQLSLSFEYDEEALFTDCVELSVMDVQMGPIGIWGFGGSVREYAWEIDEENNEVRVEVPKYKWDDQKDVAYMLLANSVTISGAHGTKISESTIENMDVDMKMFGTITAELSDENKKQIRQRIREREVQVGQTVVVLTKLGKYTVTLNGKGTVMGTAEGQFVKIDAAAKGEIWTITVVRELEQRQKTIIQTRLTNLCSEPVPTALRWDAEDVVRRSRNTLEGMIWQMDAAEFLNWWKDKMIPTAVKWTHVGAMHEVIYGGLANAIKNSDLVGEKWYCGTCEHSWDNYCDVVAGKCKPFAADRFFPPSGANDTCARMGAKHSHDALRRAEEEMARRILKDAGEEATNQFFDSIADKYDAPKAETLLEVMKESKEFYDEATGAE